MGLLVLLDTHGVGAFLWNRSFSSTILESDWIRVYLKFVATIKLLLGTEKKSEPRGMKTHVEHTGAAQKFPPGLMFKVWYSMLAYPTSDMMFCSTSWKLMSIANPLRFSWGMGLRQVGISSVFTNNFCSYSKPSKFQDDQCSLAVVKKPLVTRATRLTGFTLCGSPRCCHSEPTKIKVM